MKLKTKQEMIIYSRMQFLKANPVPVTKNLEGMNNSFSNCHGTVAYVLGIEDTFKKNAQDNEDFLYIEGTPACAGRDLMKYFLETECDLIKEDCKFGDIVAFWSNIHRVTANMPTPQTREDMRRLLDLPPVKTIEHTSILVEPKIERIFHQQETGKEFEFNTIDKYISEWFPDFRGRGVNLFVDFYRLK